MKGEFPRYPRLAAHVMARRYLGGAGPSTVVLYDIELSRNPHVSERAYAIMSGMDGTRDLRGLMAFAGAQGVVASEAELETLLGELFEAGMLVEGASTPARDAAEAGESSLPNESHAANEVPDCAARPIEQLPGFSLSCDGGGTCCRFYPTVIFSPLEAARARSHQPEVLSGGQHPSLVFLPLAGNAPGPVAVSLRQGRCAYLAQDGACGVHRASSAQQKPLGCQLYPARFVDDGTALRVSPWLECACVLHSGADKREGSPLTAARVRADLPKPVAVEPLPLEIRLSTTRTASAAEFAGLSRVWAEVPVQDAAASFMALARALERDEAGAFASAAPAAFTEGEQQSAIDALLPHFRAMVPRIREFAGESWRGPGDIVRQTGLALEQACDIAQHALGDLLEGPGVWQAAEAFYFRATIWGYHWLPRSERTLALMARDRAARVLLARALAVTSALADLKDPAFRQPLALVEAAMRAYGISAYLQELETS